MIVLDDLEGPVILVLNGLDSPPELVAQGLREELLDRYIKLLGEDDSEAGVNIVLCLLAWI